MVFTALLLGAPDKAPGLDIRDTKGKLWSISALPAGRPVLIEFWATWCGTCKKMEPGLRELFASRKEGSWDFLSVSIDTDAAALRAHLKKSPKPWPVLLDSKNAAADRWKVNAVPAFFLLRDGKVIQKWVGEVKMEVLKKALE